MLDHPDAELFKRTTWMTKNQRRERTMAVTIATKMKTLQKTNHCQMSTLISWPENSPTLLSTGSHWTRCSQTMPMRYDEDLGELPGADYQQLRPSISCVTCG